MERPEAGYRESEHTADWQLEVWAPDLPALLEQAARGMYALSGVQMGPGGLTERVIEIQAQDAEDALVGFLSELLYLAEQEGLAFEAFEIDMSGENLLHARVSGRRIASLDKEIKAVTYHNLKVETSPLGLQATIVFDV